MCVSVARAFRSSHTSRRLVCFPFPQTVLAVSRSHAHVCVCLCVFARSIVNADNVVVGIGYNGFPIGCSDDELPWGDEGPELDTKFPVRGPCTLSWSFSAAIPRVAVECA